jgi:integrase/recombinase XerD
VPRFQEKGGRSRDIPVRHDRKTYIRMYVDMENIAGETRDRLLFHLTQGTTKLLTDRPLTTKDVCGGSRMPGCRVGCRRALSG